MVGSVPSVSSGDDTFYVCADIKRITEKKWKNFLQNIRRPTGEIQPVKARDKSARIRSRN